MITNLSGSDIEALSKTLASALNFDSLKIFTHASTGDRLYVEYVGTGKPLRLTIVDLLNALEEIGITFLFLGYVYQNFPYRPDVREIIAERCPAAVVPITDGGTQLSVQSKGKTQPDGPTRAAAPGLQRNVRPHVHNVDLGVWLERLTQIEHRVCRIEFDGNAAGTGFLVGPDVVLTNWHVVETAASQLGRLGCRFDYLRLSGGTRQPGFLVRLHAAGLIDWSACSPAEKADQADGPLPTSDQLDYALLRLESPAGKQLVDGNERGWVVLPDKTPNLKPGAPILIVQHPDGSPMKLALDTDAVISINANETRIRYATNTDPGSSGSPCFTMDWDLAALHHYGDPAWKAPTFNQGVAIGMVRQLIISRGFGACLGS